MNLSENNDGHYFPLVPANKPKPKGKELAIIKKPSKVGRPKFEIDAKVLAALEYYAARGLNNKQIATCLGISHQTFCLRKNEYPEFSEAIERGRAFGVAEVTNALFEKCKKGDIFAIKYFLNNRSKDEDGRNDWQEKPEIQINQNTQINIVVDSDDLNA